MGRKCSHCGNIGHNSRTCTSYNRGNVNSTILIGGGGGGGLRLFGVQLDTPHSMVIKKCLSMDCLASSSPLQASTSHSPSSSLSSSRVSASDLKSMSLGYASDGLRAQERKKGMQESSTILFTYILYESVEKFSLWLHYIMYATICHACIQL